MNWLKEQLQISKKKTFGSSSERTEQLYEQMTLFFNEAEALEDTENRNTEIKENDLDPVLSGKYEESA